jgi:hypothetical protein
MRSWRALALGTLLLLVVVTGCGTVSERESEAAAAASRFLTAVGDGDGEAACAALAPDTIAALERSAGEPCADAVLGEDLPGPADVEATDVYGQWARVVLAGDTLFLAVFPGGWRVVAAGCRSQGDQPYDCALQGG